MTDPEAFKFCLYVADDTLNARLAVANLRSICGQYLAGKHSIEIVNVMTDLDRAMADQVFVTPTLIKLSPLPVERIIGTLSQSNQVLQVLGLGPTPAKISMGTLAETNRREAAIPKLIVDIQELGQRLETITAGEVDSAMDLKGRILLLLGIPKQLEQDGVARQAAILNALPAHIALLDSSGIIVAVNDSWRLFAGETSLRGGPGNLVGVNYLALCDSTTALNSKDAHLAAEGIRAVLSGTKKSYSLDYEAHLPASRKWYQLTVTPLSAQRQKGVIVKHEDINDSKRHQSDLASFAERLSLATEVANVGVWDWDTASSELVWDRTMRAIYGFPQTGPLSYEQWKAAVHPEDLPEVEAKLQRVIAQGGDEKAEFRITAVDGSLRYVSAAERGVTDQSGSVCRVIGVNIDVTERKTAEEELRRRQAAMTHLAEHDALTDLPNQRLLRDRIQQAIRIAAREAKKVAILYLDLDGFKHINDSLGHAIGDKLLISIAARLVHSAHAADTVCRFGGDEFVIMLPNAIHFEGIGIQAARTLEAVAAIHSIDQLELQVTASIGISVYPDDGLDAETLIQNADIAMYDAKNSGESNFQFFRSDMHLQAVERQFIEQNLRLAIKRNEFKLHYQPKYDLKTRRIEGVEALLRWNHPIRGPISPATFVPIAEDCGLIVPLGKWVLEKACGQARVWLDAGLPKISVAVNVSGKQLQSEDFEDYVLGILEQCHIPPEYLELEVTESLLMKNPELTVRLLQSLRRKGIRIALDDFGTGYSSLSYLRRFPTDTLKIDQSFIREIDTPVGASIVKAVIDLGHQLGMRVVAEGIETQQEEKALSEMNCDRGQGYFFSRPLTPENLVALLECSMQAEVA